MAVAPTVDVFNEREVWKLMISGKPLLVHGRRKASAPVIAEFERLNIKAEQAHGNAPADAVHLVVGYPGDGQLRDRDDVLPLRITENSTGAGRAMISWVRAYLEGATDAVVLAGGDEAGLLRGARRLARMKEGPEPPAEQRLTAPAMQPALPASLQQNVLPNWGARLACISAAGDTVAVGAAEWGNNLFLLNAADGAVLAAAKAGRFFVDDLWLSGDGSRIGAEAIYPEDVNAYLEMFDRNGRSLARFARDGINSHGNRSYFNHTSRRDVFGFALSDGQAPNGPVVYSSSNLGLSATRFDGALLWRHDYAPMQDSLDHLRAKWASLIDLTPDGRRLAVGLTHETFVGCRYRGISKVQMVEAAGGRILWEVPLEPIEAPHISEISISPDGRTIAVVGHGKLLLLRDGAIVRERSSGSHPHWSADSRMLYVFAEPKRRDNGILALNADGVPVWQHQQPEPLTAMAVAGAEGVVIVDAARRVTRLSEKGEVLWQTRIDATGKACVSGDAVFVCDWRGNVYRLALDTGRQQWKTNLTDRVWRDDIEQLPATPYAGPTYGLVQRRAAEQPLQGPNIAPRAKVTAGGEPGWFASGRVNVAAKDLVNGKTNDLAGPWLDIANQYKADNWSKLVWVELQWPEEVAIAGLSIHEDERHPESWPYDCCVQVWRDGAWHDAAVSLMNPGPWHNLVFEKPLRAARIRYWVTSQVSNNVWTDELRVFAAEE